MTKKNTELAELDRENAFVALADFQMGEALREELDGLDAGFERVKIPSGGALLYELPGDDPDDPVAEKEFKAVVLYHHTLFSYYKEKYTGGKQAPDCGSFDGISGVGTPGGSCAVCPLNQFGSGENGAKACKNKRRLYLLREGEIFPLLLTLPTGSLKEFTKYLKRLLSKGLRSNAVVTRFSLKKAVNTGGIAYSQAQFAADRKLTPPEAALIGRMSEEIKGFAGRVGFEIDGVPEDDGEAMPPFDPETGEIMEPLRG